MHRLEHANLASANVEALVRFVQTAFPEFAIRGQGTDTRERNDYRR